MESPRASTPFYQTRWITWIWLGALYLAGVVLWGYYFSWGRFSLNFHDWAQITGPRLAFLKDALAKGLLPLHISNPSALGSITDRFLAIPDQILSPQVILLLILPIGVFVTGHVLLLYSLGFGGLLWLRRKFSLSPFAFIILFFLFNFNGHILAHLAVGHATWGGYFLFPWFAILVFQLVEGKRGWIWIAKMALLLFIIFLQGSYHQFVWALLFLALLAVAKREYFLTAGGGALFAVLLSLVRILPPAGLVGNFTNEFYSGYINLADLWKALITILPTEAKTHSFLIATPLSYWEVNLYVGLGGAVFLLYFGIWRWLSDRSIHSEYQRLALPVLGLVVISMGQIFSVIRLVPIPLLDGERVSTRIISLPLVFILIFAVIYFQAWLDQPHRNASLFTIFISMMIIIGLNDLWENFKVWRVATAALTFKEKLFDPQSWMVANHPDPDYFGLLLVGAALSLISLGVLFLLSRRSHRQVA